MQGCCGTAYSVAPEVVLSGAGYTEKADIWSVGVIAYFLLSGKVPFLMGAEDFDDPAKLQKLDNGVIDWSPPTFRHLTNESKFFIAGMCKRRPGSRCVSFVAAQHQ